MQTSKISKKGQIVIPKPIREKMALKAGDTLHFYQVGERVYLEKDNFQELPKLSQILKQGKKFPTGFLRQLRDEWE